MAFMMPVVKNDWDIYNSQRGRRVSEAADKSGRVRKVSESRSEGPALGTRPTLSPHRSAPAMRSLSYCRTPASRVSLRAESRQPAAAGPQPGRDDKFPSRLVERLKRALGREPREERAS